jgi:hypothetical protein
MGPGALSKDDIDRFYATLWAVYGSPERVHNSAPLRLVCSTVEGGVPREAADLVCRGDLRFGVLCGAPRG